MDAHQSRFVKKMKRYFLLLNFLWLALYVQSSPDTVAISLYKYQKKIDIKQQCKIAISFTDSFGNKTVIKPKVSNGYFYGNDFKFLKNCSITFRYKLYKFRFDSSILIFDKKVTWQFGIDTTLDEYFRNYPEFMEGLPHKHSYYYLKMEPLYEGRGYTEYRFMNYRKKKPIKVK